jgi:hypothetical protein
MPFFSFGSFGPYSQSQSFSPFYQPQSFYSHFRQPQSYNPFSQFGFFSPFGSPFPGPFPNQGSSNTPSNSGLAGFDKSNTIINLNDLISGASGKDSIPPLTSPEYVSAASANFMDDGDLVVGVTIDGQSWAYPLKILNYHEIVNDVLAGTRVAVTWCPLTRSAIVFNRRIGGETIEFGVSGFLYNSNLVMYDRTYSALWPQLQLGAVTGRFSGQDLQIIPSKVTTWEDWRINQPDTSVLSDDTGYSRDYDNDPYQSYQSSNEIRFPVNNSDGRLPGKNFVIGIRINNRSTAYSMDFINDLAGPYEDEIDVEPVQVFPGPEDTAYITDDEGELLPGILLYWFAWSAFNPNTTVVD